MAERGYSVAEVARMFKVSRATVHNWRERFPNAYPLGDAATSAIVIPPEDIEKVRDEEIETLKMRIEELKSIRVAK